MMNLEDLEPLVGAWDAEMRMPDGRVLSGAWTTFAWLDRGGYLVQHSGPPTDEPAFPSSVSAIGPTRDGDRIVQHYFDSRGVARVYEIAFDDGALRLWREDDPAFAQRYAGRFEDGGETIAGAWEKRLDGSTWEHDFALTYRRRHS